MLKIVDLLVINTALLLGLKLRLSIGTTHWNTYGIGRQITWFMVLSGLWLILGPLFNIYEPFHFGDRIRSLFLTCGVALLTVFVYLFIPYLTPNFPARRLEALLFPVLTIIGIGLWRSFYSLFFGHSRFLQHALVVGAGWSGATLARAISELNSHSRNRNNQGSGYRLLGFVDDNVEKADQLIEGLPVIGTSADLVSLVRHVKPDELIVAITHPRSIRSELFQAILDCREMGVPVTTMTTVYERLTGRVPVEHAGRDLHVVMPVNVSATHRLFLLVKRLVDIFVGLTGCLVTILLTPFIWVANGLCSPGPVFYRQERVGKAGKLFQVVKFRSMTVDAESQSGATWATQTDPRVTPVGWFLRRTRLDEIPQFWNVLKGEMSVIGPRPERPSFTQELAKEIPFYQVRHAVKPGITGWAQVQFGYAASVEDTLIKLQYDLFYIKNTGLLLEGEIVLKTIAVMVGFGGR